MKKVYPILKNNNQFKGYNDRGFFIEYLFSSDKENSPIILYGEDQGYAIAYSPSVSKENDLIIKDEALRNLKQIDVPFQIQKINGNEMLYALHEYAAEKILDKNFLLEISKALGSSSILVGIPIKGFLAASVKGKGDDNFFSAITNMYDNPQSDTIFRFIFFIQNGEIEMMAVPKESKLTNTYSLTGEFDSNGKIGFKVVLINDTEDGIANQIQEAYQSILAKIPENLKKYNGKVNFYLSAEIDLTKKLKERLVKIANNISERGAVQIIGALIGEEFKIKFYDGQNQLISETVEKDPVQLKQNGEQIKKENKLNEKSNLNNYSIQELDDEFNEILKIPNAQTDAEALTKMADLLEEYKIRNIETPDVRANKVKKNTPITQKKIQEEDKDIEDLVNCINGMEEYAEYKINRQKAKKTGNTLNKKWWEFWK